jgi:hypothetical protein
MKAMLMRLLIVAFSKNKLQKKALERGREEKGQKYILIRKL